MSLQSVIKQIKDTGDRLEESNSIYLNEIYDTLVDKFEKTISTSISMNTGVISSISRLEQHSDNSKVVDSLDELIKLVREGNQKIIESQMETVREQIKDSKYSERMIKEFDEIFKNDSSRIEKIVASNDSSFGRVEKIISDNQLLLSNILSSNSSSVQTSDRESNTLASNNVNTQSIDGTSALKETLIEASSESNSILLEENRNSTDSIVDKLTDLRNAYVSVTSKDSTEDKREKTEREERLIESLTQVKEGVSNLKSGLGDVVKGGAKAFGIGALIAMFIKPELVMKGLSVALKVFEDGVKALTGILNGSMDGVWEFIKNNPFTSIGIALFGLMKIVPLITKSISLLGSGISTISGAFTLITKGLTLGASALGIGVAPFVAAIAGVGVAIYSIIKAFDDAISMFNDTGSFIEASFEFFSSAIANFFGFILDLPKRLISTIAGWLGFEEVEKMLDSFSFVDLFKPIVDMLLYIPKRLIKAINGIIHTISFGLLGEDNDLVDAKKNVSDTKKELAKAKTPEEKKEAQENYNESLVELAKESDLVNPEVFGHSKIDRKKFESDETSVDMIDAVLQKYGDDFSKEDIKFLNELKVKKQSANKKEIDASVKSSEDVSTIEKTSEVINLIDTSEKSQLESSLEKTKEVGTNANISSTIEKMARIDSSSSNAMANNDSSTLVEKMARIDSSSSNAISNANISSTIEKMARIDSSSSNAMANNDSNVLVEAPFNNSYEKTIFSQMSDILTTLIDNHPISKGINLVKSLTSGDGSIMDNTITNIKDSYSSIKQSLFGGDTVSNMVSPVSSSQSISTTMDNIKQNVAKTITSDSSVSKLLESRNIVSELRNNQVINNELRDMDESRKAAMIASSLSTVVSNTSANNNTTIINNNGPTIDDILKDKLYNPA